MFCLSTTAPHAKLASKIVATEATLEASEASMTESTSEAPSPVSHIEEGIVLRTSLCLGLKYILISSLSNKSINSNHRNHSSLPLVMEKMAGGGAGPTNSEQKTYYPVHRGVSQLEHRGVFVCLTDSTKCTHGKDSCP